MRRMVITVIIIYLFILFLPCPCMKHYHGDILQLLDQYIYFGVSITRGAPSLREF